MLELIPWIPTSGDSHLCPWSWRAAETGQYRRSEGATQTGLTPNLWITLSGLYSTETDLLTQSYMCSVTGADPYVIISCEGRSVKSIIKKDTLEPEFTISGIFYRKKPRKPITVEVRWRLTGLMKLQGVFFKSAFYFLLLTCIVWPDWSSSGVEQQRSEGRVYGPSGVIRVSERQIWPSDPSAAEARTPDGGWDARTHQPEDHQCFSVDRHLTSAVTRERELNVLQRWSILWDLFDVRHHPSAQTGRCSACLLLLDVRRNVLY